MVAVVQTIITEVYSGLTVSELLMLQSFEKAYSLVGTAMAFLLVFRLNRRSSLAPLPPAPSNPNLHA